LRGDASAFTEAFGRKGQQCTAMTMTEIATILLAWSQRARTRSHLRGLEAHRLADIGLSEEDRRDECAKWFWQT
jgi:uncharacterized protein YjiS (DUF1127 family)